MRWFVPEAWPFVLPFWVLSGLLVGLGLWGWAAGLAFVGLLVLAFFRNPDRGFQGPEELVLAPADGRILSVERLEEAEIGSGEFWRVATFLSVLDVHVQRCPVSGTIVRSLYRRGEKRAAFQPQAGSLNEAITTVFETSNGLRVGVRQIAGLIARRVKSYRKEQETCRRGELLGVIKFGSRVDLFVPASFHVLVKRGDRVRAGETVVARP